MQALDDAERQRIDGLAVFATAAFAVGVAATAALERVGAPDGLVEGLAPLLAVCVLSVIGLANRAASLTDFLAARRAVPGFYAALAFAAVAAGVVVVLLAGAREPTDVPWLAIGAGAALSGAIVGPAIRRGNFSAPIDVLATRFPAIPARLAFALAQFGCSTLVASAGFSVAAQALSGTIGGRASAAMAICALAFTLAPGGMKSAVWTDAASGGGAILIALFGAVFAALWVPEPFVPLREAAALLTAQAQTARLDPSQAVSLAIAFAFFVPWLAPGMVTPSGREARRAGLAGFVYAGLGLAAAAVALPALAVAPVSAEHAGRGLVAAATWLPSLALARGGVLAASGAPGIDLARAYSRLTVLATQRIAIQRLVMGLVIALSPFGLAHLHLSADRALILALSGSLAFLAPPLVLALALPARAASPAAIVALAAAGGALALQYRLDRHGFEGLGVVSEALAAASLALGSGALAALLAPARGSQRSLPPADPFIDLPFDLLDGSATLSPPAA